MSHTDHYPEEWGPSSDRRLTCVCGNPDPAHMDHVAQALAEAHAATAAPWPATRDVARLDDMSPSGHLRITLDNDNDVCVEVFNGQRFASVEFCNGGGGGGQSPRTRLALIALMVAMEADTAENRSRAHPRFSPPA